MRRPHVLLVLALLGGMAAAGPFEDGVALVGQGKYAEALAAFDREIHVRPAHTETYTYAGLAAEKLSDWKRAARYWEMLLKVSEDVTERTMASAHLQRCRAKLGTRPGPSSAPSVKRTVKVFSTADKRFHKVKTEHFMVLAKNRELAEEAGRMGEIHLKRICAAFLRGRLWPRVINIYIFRDKKEYTRERGLPDWSGGGYSFIRYSADNVVRRVDLYQFDEKGRYRKELLTKILPHELTHVVMEEWFGERKMPLALNEGLAMYVEEGTHEDYEAQCARRVAMKQYFHLKDLFAFQKYPRQVGVFYVQSASVTRYLISHLSEDQFERMMDALKRGEDMNTALCTATGKVGDLLANVETNWLKKMRRKAVAIPPR